MVNDQHPHAGYVGDGAHSTGSYATDPLFGAYGDGGADQSGQWNLGGYDVTGTYGTAEQYGTTTGQYDTTQYDATGTYDTTGHYTTATATAPYEATGAYDTTGQWNTTGQWDTTGAYDTTGTYATSTGAYETTTGPYDTATAQHGTAPAYDATGQWDASAWTEAQHTGQYETVHAAYAAQGAEGASPTEFGGGYESYDATGQWAAPAFATDTGAYDATAWNTASPEAEPVVPHQYTPGPEHTAEFAFAYVPDAEAGTAAEPDEADPVHDRVDAGDHEDHEEPADDHEGRAHEDADPGYDDQPAVEVRTDAPPAGRPVRRSPSGGSRGRRRTPAKRSALLTVAVPSACVMGVAGIAAASVGGLTGAGAENAKKEDTTALAAADPASVKQVAANNALDTQLAALSADARSFGDRASRTQERIDLKARQAADKKKREEEAARKEALRPKFALPVQLHRLSARFGQSGVNWMSVHTGIDFPVQTGTPVMAATDGTVRTQINSAYGNMVIVTAPDGTETWYCHLSSAKIRYGQVKAGDVIAYSGDTGNSTGPHLHFEVRPGGGYAIDPLAWLRTHGLDPTT
ncbi:peptidoglycan DD-metalloendopeptidase family protein [Streptomyces sp. NPDC039028]|uniref:peptidoglycan DD-metalloendopeptidase family protein n=1 Tax=unclassified Streptomyces TaxID=2593676 RepID=UPI0033CB9D6D